MEPSAVPDGSPSLHPMDATVSSTTLGPNTAVNPKDIRDSRQTSSTSLASAASSSSTSSKTQPPIPRRTPSASSISVSSSSINKAAHRQSFAEELRNPPVSPRRRQPSVTQIAVQDLLNNPPASRHSNSRFAGREWRDVHVGELTSPDDVRWATMATSVEEATMVSKFMRRQRLD